MEILNEFDEYVAALKKVDLNEEVMPYVRGKLLTENVEIYAKIQKLLGCRAFEPCHRFLYDLDIENIDESEASKVNNLYQLGIERGFIDDISSDDEEEKEEVQAAEVAVVPQTAPAAQPAFAQAPAQSAFTVLYSAMRDGQIKTGEAFSNAINTRSAKADVISKLERAGYSNISILAIEAGDPDMQGCTNTFCKQANEADSREPLSHALDPVGVKASTANSAAQDAVSMSIVEKDKAEDDASKKDEESVDNKEEDSATVDTEADAKAADKDAEDEETASDEESAEDAEAAKDEKPADDGKEDKTEDDAGEDNKEDSSKKELSASEKSTLKDAYKKAFKAAMLKLKFEEKCFDDLTLEEKVDFFTEMADSWKDKADPKDFMTAKEVEALEKIVIKK